MAPPLFFALVTARPRVLTASPFDFPTVKAYELYTAVDPAIVTQMLDWFRANDRNVYKSAVATLAGNRKLRPVFIEKKPLARQSSYTRFARLNSTWSPTFG